MGIFDFLKKKSSDTSDVASDTATPMTPEVEATPMEAPATETPVAEASSVEAPAVETPDFETLSEPTTEVPQV